MGMAPKYVIYITLHYITLRYVTLRYVTLHYITCIFVGLWITMGTAPRLGSAVAVRTGSDLRFGLMLLHSCPREQSATFLLLLNRRDRKPTLQKNRGSAAGVLAPVLRSRLVFAGAFGRLQQHSTRRELLLDRWGLEPSMAIYGTTNAKESYLRTVGDHGPTFWLCSANEVDTNPGTKVGLLSFQFNRCDFELPHYSS